MKTPEEYARAVCKYGWLGTAMAIDRVAEWFRDYGDERADQMRQACLDALEPWGDEYIIEAVYDAVSDAKVPEETGEQE